MKKYSPEDNVRYIRARLQREAARRSALSSGPVSIVVDGAEVLELGGSQTTIGLKRGARMVDIVGHDNDGQIFIDSYLLIYDEPKTEVWNVRLPWGDEIVCRFQYRDDDRVFATLKLTSASEASRDPVVRREGRIGGGDTIAAWTRLARAVLHPRIPDNLPSSLDPEWITNELRKRGLGASDIEDVVDSVILRVIQKGSVPRDPARFRAFLRYEVRDVAKEYWGRSRAYTPMEEVDLQLPRMDFQLDVKKALEQLPPRWAQALALVYMNEYSYKEAAKTLGCSMAQVHKTLQKARGRMRDLLDALGSPQSKGTDKSRPPRRRDRSR